MFNTVIVLGTIGLLSGSIGGAAAWADPSPTPSQGLVSEQASANNNAEYKDIYQLFTSGEYDAVLKRTTSFERMYPSSKILTSIENLHGMTYLMMKQPALAIPHFKKAADLSRGQPNFSQYVGYNLATSQYEASQFDDAEDTLNDLHPELLDRENQIKVHYLKARLLDKRAQAFEAAKECLTASRLFTAAEAQDNRSASGSLTALLDSFMSEITDLGQIQELNKTFSDSPITDILLFRLASLQIKDGSRRDGLATLQLLVDKYPLSSKVALANPILNAEKEGGPVDKTLVGVLLPLKGKFARFGSRSLESLELAFGVFGSEVAGNGISLVMEDSGEDADQAVAALERLANHHRVVAVIGPLLSKGIDQVSQRAQELGIPLISLARASSAATSGNFVFQAGITLQMQIEQIAQYAVKNLGLTKFAEVYPKDKVGIETGNFFWDAIDGLGGEMVGAESYAPGETDYRQVVDKLSGLYYTESRQKELDELAKDRERNHIRKRTRKTEEYYSLKPIVDYQAVFIPEEPKSTGQILPTFAYRDVDKIRFLGTAAWNSNDLISRAQNYAEGVLFTDAFYVGNGKGKEHQFFDDFKNTFGSDPTSMEAIAFDAGLLVNQTLLDGASTRADVKDRLQSVKNFAGVTGKITYVNGLFNRDLKVLTIRGGKIVEASKDAKQASTK